jgi:hypothetical protein
MKLTITEVTSDFVIINSKKWRRIGTGRSCRVYKSPDNKYVFKITDEETAKSALKFWKHNSRHEMLAKIYDIYKLPKALIEYTGLSYGILQEYAGSNNHLPKSLRDQFKSAVLNLGLDDDVGYYSDGSLYNAAYIPSKKQVKIYDFELW